MADFTIELGDVVEAIYGTSYDPSDWEQPYKDVTYNGIEYGHLPYVTDWKKMGLGYYPIFDEKYRDVLNGKILTEFFKREICVETVDLWIQRVQAKMQIIMPYYNKLYKSEQIPYEALSSISIDTSRRDLVNGTEDSSSATNAKSSTASNARAVNSDTPQTMLSGDEDYANGATDTNSKTTADTDSTGTATTTSNNEVNGRSIVSGYQGSASDLIMKFRDSLLNIDAMVIRDMQELFMGIMNNSDNYSRNGYYY